MNGYRKLLPPVGDRSGRLGREPRQDGARMAQPTYEQLQAENQCLRQRVAELEAQVRQLTAKLQEALRVWWTIDLRSEHVR